MKTDKQQIIYLTKKYGKAKLSQTKRINSPNWNMMEWRDSKGELIASIPREEYHEPSL